MKHVTALVAVAAILFSSFARTDDWPARIAEETRRVESRMVEIRHDIHQHPELSNREERTATLVAEYLRLLGLEVRTGIAHHGVVALLKGGKPGPVVAVRADMDALPVTEETRLPFASTVRATYLGQDVGVMHACGHDVHTTVQLGVATVLNAMKADLPGTVKLVFQPAEEGAPPGEEGGSALMVKEGALDNPRPQAIFALHAMPEMAVGEVAYSQGAAMSSSDRWEVKIIGRQAHGARPELSIDPIVTAATFVSALQTIRSRTFSGLEPGVVTVGTIHGGQRNNIIPSEVSLTGTIRTFRREVSELAEKRLREILKGVTDAAGAQGEVVRYDRFAPATINDPALTSEAAAALERVLGKKHVARIPPSMASEDFSNFANLVPGFFFRLGNAAPGDTSGDLHTPTFRADDSSIGVGIRAMSYLLLNYLQLHSGG
jgi:amidohydrolase